MLFAAAFYCPFKADSTRQEPILHLFYVVFKYLTFWYTLNPMTNKNDQNKPVSQNIVWHNAETTTEEREQSLAQKGAVVWFTGLSGSGKSTVAHRVEKLLLARHKNAFVLDGDNVRHGLNKDLGFAPQDRTENIRRVSEVARLMQQANVIVLCAFISPYRVDREQARKIAGNGFVETYCSANVVVCADRDPKGLYKKAQAGEIPEFTGVSAPYEAPQQAEIVLDTATKSLEDCAAEVVAYLVKNGFIAA